MTEDVSDKATDNRRCTCHPDERPKPCQHKYAWWDCMKARVAELEAALKAAEARIEALRRDCANLDYAVRNEPSAVQEARATALLEALREFVDFRSTSSEAFHPLLEKAFEAALALVNQHGATNER